MTVKDGSISQGRRCVPGAIIASGFFAALGMALVSFTLPLASLDARVSGAWLGTGFAGFFLARLLAGPLGGLWADSGGARMPLLAGAAIGALAPLAYVAHPSVSALYFIQFVLGGVSGLIRPVGLAVLGGSAPSGSEEGWFAAHVLAFNVALFTGPLLGGFLYWNRSMEPVLAGVVACMVVAHLCVFAGVPASVRSKRTSVGAEDNSPVQRELGVLLLAVFGRSLGLGLFIAFYPLLLTMRAGKAPLLVAALFALPNLVVCAGLFPLRRLTARYSGVAVTVGGLTLSSLGLFGAGIGTDIPAFIFSGAVMGLGTALSMPASMNLISRTRQGQGRVFGVAHATTGVGLVLGPLLGGLILTWSGSFGLAFELAALIGVLCCVPLLWSKGGGGVSKLARWAKGVLAVLAATLLIVGLARVDAALNVVSIPDDGLYRFTDMAMGTVVHLTLDADSRKAADDAARKVLAYMHAARADLDFRDPEGSVGRINRGAGSYYVEPSRRAYSLIRRAVALSRATGGVFDPTVGALTTSPLYYVLDEAIAESKKGLVDYRKVLFEEGRWRVKLERKGMALDLGGIAKGAIVDGAVRLLRSEGVRAGIVEAGGDFYCFGPRDWTVGIRHPREDKVFVTVTVREKGVCGSGDYQQFVKVEEADGISLRHHIIDPEDMEPADRSAGVTVIAGSAELADGLATALFITGPARGKLLLDNTYPDVSALWFSRDLKVSVTDNFPKK
ncbi:MFS transporter [Pseudodesulfovibrio cashew]|uniref:FAD:protein FMN transferase n=1 Tax=Pseudodesulfovibrio cashew TaxID=2678688 RepID=A0A6I6JL86_9BACT|nr:MFS transporter [Pseudodesulfovibrio cashew]QGY41033.1 MFS transporter [Pseudodesulfovibrio cashew]